MNKERKQILVIEDDNGIVEVLTALFTIHNIPAIFANSGNMAFDILKCNTPSLIICDFMLPDINGDIILKEVKKNTSTQNIPFIFLSAFADSEDIKSGLALGADDYITKPFSASKLIHTIKSNLETTCTI